MASYTVRGVSIYKDGRRLGTIKEGNFTEPDGGENQITEDGFVARSVGVPVCTLSTTSLVPVSSVPITDIKPGDRFMMTIAPWGGKRLQSKMWCTQVGGTWNHASGTNDGTWEFTGPRFERIG